MALEITIHFPRAKWKARLLSTETCVGIGMGLARFQEEELSYITRLLVQLKPNISNDYIRNMHVIALSMYQPIRSILILGQKKKIVVFRYRR